MIVFLGYLFGGVITQGKGASICGERQYLFPLLLWFVLFDPTSAMLPSCKAAAFALPPLASYAGRFLRLSERGCSALSSSMIFSSRATMPTQGKHSPVPINAWPIFARKPLMVLRGGARERQGERSLSVASAKTRTSGAVSADDDDSMGGDGGGKARAKEPRKSKGDLVDIDVSTGQEIRRRARGRGRSLAGYVMREDGDWVRQVGDTDSSTQPGKQSPKQQTLSPFLADRARKGDSQTRIADSEIGRETSDVDTSAPATSLHDELSGEGRIADEVLSAMGAMDHFEIPPRDESLWEDLPSKVRLCICTVPESPEYPASADSPFSLASSSPPSFPPRLFFWTIPT